MESEKENFWKYDRDFRKYKFAKEYLAKYQTIILDLDHTLYNEYEFLYQSYSNFLNNIKILKKEEKLEILNQSMKWVIRGERSQIFQLLSRNYPVLKNCNLEEFLYSLRNSKKSIKLFSGVKIFLEILKVDKKNIFILTNGNKQQQESKVKALNLSSIIQKKNIFFAIGKLKKPNPEGIKKIMEFSCSVAESTILIGDSEEDEEASKKANINFFPIESLFPKVKNNDQT